MTSTSPDSDADDNIPEESKPWVNNFIYKDSDYKGYVGSVSDVGMLIWEFEVATDSHFKKQRTKRAFGQNPDLKNMETITVRWEDSQGNAHPPLNFDGVPFIIIGTQTFNCHQGKNYDAKRKKSNQPEKKSDTDHGYSRKKKRRLVQTTKKMGCEASIYVRHIIKFKDYKCQSGTKREKELIARQLKSDLKSKDIDIDHQFHVELPESHSQKHLQGQIAGTVLPIDKELSSYIHEKVLEESIYSSKEMQVLLREFVINKFKELGKRLPPRTNTRFWPTLGQIRNHMVLATMRSRNSAMDQTTLCRMVEKWKSASPDDSFFLRLKPSEEELDNVDDLMESDDIIDIIESSSTKENRRNFLYIHQTRWQRELLNKYGQELVLLDATYRTSKYSVPLFFVAVPTNVNYVVVAHFLTDVESSAAIQEALTILRQWNKDWTPKYFITDSCEQEISAVENTFSDCGTFVYLCDFHRLQAWNRWLKASVHGIQQSRNDPLLAVMKSIGDSYSEVEMDKCIENLMKQPEWETNRSFRIWFQTHYLEKKERWVKIYRQERFNAINTTNGVERQNSNLKHGYLWTVGYKKNQTISQLAHIMVNRYQPTCLQGYLRQNAMASSSVREYDSQIPDFLHDRPTRFVQHVMKRYAEVGDLSVDEVSDGQYFVESASDPSIRYEVFLDAGNGIPSCQCHDWKRHHYPCKHILSIIVADNDVTWDSLPATYTQSPFLTLDLTRHNMSISSVDTLDELHVVDDPESNLPSNENNILQIQRNVRECLKDIEGLTYLCDNEETLKHCLNILAKLKGDIEASCPSDGGLLVEPNVNVPIASKQPGTLKARRGLKKVGHTTNKGISKGKQPVTKRRRRPVLKSVRALRRPGKIRFDQLKKGSQQSLAAVRRPQQIKPREKNVHVDQDSAEKDLTATSQETSTCDLGSQQDHEERSTFDLGSQKGRVDTSTCNLGSQKGRVDTSTCNLGSQKGRVDTSTCNLGSQQGRVETSTCNLGSQQGHVETSTFNLGSQQGRVETSTFNLGSQQGRVETSTFNLGSQQGRVETSTFNLGSQQGREHVNEEMSIPKDVDQRVKQAQFLEKLIRDHLQSARYTPTPKEKDKSNNNPAKKRMGMLDEGASRFKKRKLAELELQSGVYPKAGLQNPIRRNICFANSLLQCLRLTELHRLLQLHVNCHVKSCFMCQMKIFIDEGLDTAEPMLKEMKGIWPQFQLGQQQDAHEFLQKVMEEVYSKCIQVNSQSEDNYIFHGIQKNTVVCSNCNADFNHNETFSDMTVPILEVQTIEGAIKSYFSPQEVEYKCEVCNVTAKSRKYIKLECIPRNLIIHMNRFNQARRKINKRIELSFQMDLEEYMSPEKKTEHRVELFGIVFHYGRNSSSGHYYSFVKFGQHWFRIDDMKIDSVEKDEIIKCTDQSYILFYRTLPN